MASAEPQTRDESYDPDFFLGKVSDRLICPVCHLVMEDPCVVESCGHHLCGLCLEKVKKSSGLCPIDREKMGQTFKDKGRRREIQALRRRCVKSEEGCNWKGNLGEYEDHIAKRKCILRCVNGCGNKVRIFEMKEHMEKTCPETVVDCPFKMVGDGCDFRAKRAFIKDHVTSASQQFQHLLCAATACSEMNQYIWKEAMQPTKLEDRKTTFDWVIYDFAKKKQEEVNGKVECQVSKAFYTGPCNTGYCLKLEASLNGCGCGLKTHVSIYGVICSGKNDDSLAWPFCHTITFQVLNSKTKTVVTTDILDRSNYPVVYRQKPTTGDENDSLGIEQFLHNDLLTTSSILATDCLCLQCIVDWSPW